MSPRDNTEWPRSTRERLTEVVENAEHRATLTNLQRTCESAARKIMAAYERDGADSFCTTEELAAIIYKEFRERHEL